MEQGSASKADLAAGEHVSTSFFARGRTEAPKEVDR